MASQAASDDWSDVLRRLGVDKGEADAPQHSPIDTTALAPPAQVPEGRADTEAVAEWATRDHAARQQRLRRFAAALHSHADALSLGLCVETGYPIAQCHRTITACAAHFDDVAAVLRLPPDSATDVWRPRGQTCIESAANDSITDALAEIASALYCGCTVRWCAPVNAKWVARLLLTLWQRAQSDSPAARAAWTLSEQTPSASHTDRANLVWVTPSAPVDSAIDAILAGVCWQNGLGAASVHGILVDHALHWEIDHRLSTALTQLTRLDARDGRCQLPQHRPRPELVAVPTDVQLPRASADQARVFLQPISTLPDGVCNYTVKSLSVFSIDFREIEHVRSHLTRTSSQVCINTVPSEDLAMQQSDWYPWLHPRAIRTAVDAPW